jgi:sec-independent protein translocase protein TatB
MDTGFLGISFFELIVIAAIALVVIGPDRIPEYARKFGKLVRDFRRMTTSLTGEMKKAIDLDSDITNDLKKTVSGVTNMLNEEARAISSSLDAEVSEVAKTMGIEGESLKKTLSDNTTEVGDILKRDLKAVRSSTDDVKGALDREFAEFTKTFSEGKKKLDKALGVEEKAPAPAAIKPPEKPQPVASKPPVSEPVTTPEGGGQAARGN